MAQFLMSSLPSGISCKITSSVSLPELSFINLDPILTLFHVLLLSLSNVKCINSFTCILLLIAFWGGCLLFFHSVIRTNHHMLQVLKIYH